MASPKHHVSLTLLGIKAEAEGIPAIVALVLLVALIFGGAALTARGVLPWGGSIADASAQALRNQR